MGWETSETKLECGCVKYRRTHDFFMDDGEVWYNLCNHHYFTNMTKEEYQVYYEKNKDRLNANRRQRYQENSEKEKERAREYREKNYEKVRERERERERENRRLYPELYRAKHREYSKKIYQKNKEKIDAYKCENFECACGGKYQRKSKAKHEKTQKHLNWVQSCQKV